MNSIYINDPKITSELTENGARGVFVIEPLERGYGTTLGNSLRRVLLSSLPGVAVSSIKIDGVLHEMSTVPGVKEDVTEIVLNVKGITARLNCDGPKTVAIDKTGPCEVKAGDIFRCQTDRNHYTYGIVIGKTRELEKWPELPAMHSFRNLMAQPIIVRMYDFVTSNADMTADQLSKISLRPPMICTDEDIICGTHKIVAHKELEPDDVQFQIHLARQGRNQDETHPFTAETFTNLFSKLIPEDQRKKVKAPTSLCIEWGFASIEVPWESVPDEIKEFLSKGVYYNSGTQIGISGEYSGKSLAEILHETPHNTIQYNLLLPENREKFNLIMHALGLPDDCTYDEFVIKYGGISRQKYIELEKLRCK